MSNQLLTQFSQLLDILLLVLKPMLVLYIGFFLLTLTPQEKQPSGLAAKGASLFTLQVISILLLSYGALPPLMATLAGQKLNESWYITYLFTFASGGILFLWIDNAIRELPTTIKTLVRNAINGGVRLIGTTAIVFTLVSIGLAVLNNFTNQAGWWTIPVVLFAYGLLLNWLVMEKSVQPLQKSTTKITVTKPVAKVRAKISKKASKNSSIKTRRKVKK